MSELVDHIKVLNVEPYDTIVIRTSVNVTAAQARELGAAGEREFPGHKVLVVGPDLDIDVQKTHG